MHVLGVGLGLLQKIRAYINGFLLLKDKVHNFFCFFSEIDEIETGLLIEVWDKGMLWDKAIGYFWAPLQSLQLSAVVRLIHYYLKIRQSTI